MSTGLVTRVSTVLLLALCFSSCQFGPERAPSIATAYVGPATLKIRGDIPLESPVVATVKHGDKLEILQRRRRFLRVRTPGGAEGWTDERQLLAAEDMQALRDLAATARNLPSQGQGTTFAALNVHTQPSLQSPSFLQLKENDKFEVLTHTWAPRTGNSPKPLFPPAPKKTKAVEKKPPKEPKYPPLAVPKPPPPPSNWIELSQTKLEEEAPPEEDDDRKPEKPVVKDDWLLIRASDGQSGWVLTRRVVMNIPDDVAQYAEGRRIVSYFALATVQDDNVKKQDWLWTTIGSGTFPYDFDSFRVFIWNLRRHRYETAYIERNLRGYAPVVVKDVELSIPKGSSGDTTGKYPGFSFCVEKADGQRYRREYAFLTNVVRFAGERPCETAAPPAVVAQAQAQGSGTTNPKTQTSESFTERLRKRLRDLTHGRFGG